MKEILPVSVKGHVHVQDDLGNVLVDKDNAVHPQNMARVFARALANEDNHAIHRIAFGNGGTQVDAAFTITYNTPNDGQPPDVLTWDSRLYNETYSEVVDESDADLGTDPGSAGPNAGNRPGGGSVVADDPASIEHVSGPGVRSNEIGLISEVVVTAVLNQNEPLGQFVNDNQAPSENTETSFTFDEIGLYTDGADAIASSGSADVDVGDRTSEDDTGLVANTQYSFAITTDGVADVILFTTPVAGGSGSGGEILYGDLCEGLNTGAWIDSGSLGGATVAITDNTTSFPTITGSQTYGFLRFTSGTTGITSTVLLAADATAADLFTDLVIGLNNPTGVTLQAPVDGAAAGIQNDPVNPQTERERLLTHIIFSPVLKAANRTLTVTYTLSISVARTV